MLGHAGDASKPASGCWEPVGRVWKYSPASLTLQDERQIEEGDLLRTACGALRALASVPRPKTTLTVMSDKARTERTGMTLFLLIAPSKSKGV